MDRDQANAALAEALRAIAPEVSLDEVDPDAEMIEELELDSMDVLSLVTELHERTGVDIPESDYSELTSLNATVDYLVRRSAT